MDNIKGEKQWSVSQPVCQRTRHVTSWQRLERPENEKLEVHFFPMQPKRVRRMIKDFAETPILGFGPNFLFLSGGNFFEQHSWCDMTFACLLLSLLSVFLGLFGCFCCQLIMLPFADHNMVQLSVGPDLTLFSRYGHKKCSLYCQGYQSKSSCLFNKLPQLAINESTLVGFYLKH